MAVGRISKSWIQYIFVGVLVLFCAGVWAAVYTRTPKGLLTVAVLNVGQGDSIYIESPSGRQVVIDGGPDDSLLRELPKVMPPFDRSIDVALETHPHADHIDGFIDLLKRYTVSSFVEPGVPNDTAAVATLEQEIADENIPRYIARRGMTIDLGGGALLDVLYPDHDVGNLPVAKIHEGNIVARLVYKNTSMLLMGDAPKDVEDRLAARDGVMLSSTILKVGHHGSRTSTGDAFVALVHPNYALISVGAHNVYGLPDEEPIATLVKYGAVVLRTDQVGTIVFYSDGKTFWEIAS